MEIINNKPLIFVIYFIFIILIIYCYYNTNIEQYTSITDDKHPKIIWTYWDDLTTIPETVKLCMNTWKKHNPNYQIILLTKENYPQYADIPKNIAEHKNFNDMKQRFADLVRAYVLAKHGGVWVDASIIIGEPLDNWIFSTDVEFDGFYIQEFTKTTPVIENWFFGVKQKSPFMEKWKDEFSQLANYPSCNEYVESRKKMGVNIDGIVNPTYLAMHVAAQKVLQIDRYPLTNLNLRKAEDGPFKYLVDNNWNPMIALEKACKNIDYRKPFLKLRSPERHEFEKYIKTNFDNKKCLW